MDQQDAKNVRFVFLAVSLLLSLIKQEQDCQEFMIEISNQFPKPFANSFISFLEFIG